MLLPRPLLISFNWLFTLQITHKDAKDDESVDSAPLLYHSLMGCTPPLPTKLVGLILEQVPCYILLVNNK